MDVICKFLTQLDCTELDSFKVPFLKLMRQMSNGDIYEKNHDEIDFEFLGNIRGKDWRIQTNIYGNGSTSIGREERYGLWFDPSEDFHQYSILWTENMIV